MKMARQWLRAMKVYGQCDLIHKCPENSRRESTRRRRWSRHWRRRGPSEEALKRDFSIWKREVLRLADALGWSKKAIASIDWGAFREEYYDGDNYRSPKETWNEEYSAAQ